MKRPDDRGDPAVARRLQGAALVGDPGYHGRFGFRAFPGLRPGDVPARFVQALPFDGSEPQGELIHHPALGLEQKG